MAVVVISCVRCVLSAYINQATKLVHRVHGMTVATHETCVGFDLLTSVVRDVAAVHCALTLTRRVVAFHMHASM